LSDSKIAERSCQLQKELRKLVTRVGVRFPHHVVFELHSFLQGAPSAVVSSRNQAVDNVGSKRITAQQILKEVQKTVPRLIKQVQAITTAMLNVAGLKAESTSTFQKLVEKSVKKLSEDSHAYGDVPLPCRSWFDYDLKPVYVQSISSDVVLLGGVHKPRKIKIVGSDGQSYFAILKGNDELRQDLVIQQSFNIINKLFDADGEARKRRLLMRTYNVVLLSPSAGILEMVCHSQSLTEYLVGPSQCPLKPDFASAGAHERYRPSDDVRQLSRAHVFSA
jgi:ataxia telangiectasia mutated family protein